MNENLLLAPYRRIRRVMPPDAPLAGVLAVAEGRTLLLVDAQEVPEQMWRVSEAMHVWRPVDVARTNTGHDAIFEHVSKPLMHALRSLEGAALTEGEAVTIAVSLMRGFREASSVSGASGRWWLTEYGKPVFVFGEGARLAAATERACGGLVAALHGTLIGEMLEELQEAFESEVPERAFGQVEQRLFAACAPEPLRRESSPPAAEVEAAIAWPHAEHTPTSARLASETVRALTAPSEQHEQASSTPVQAIFGRFRSWLGYAPADGTERKPKRHRRLILFGSVAAAALLLGLALSPEPAARSAAPQPTSDPQPIPSAIASKPAEQVQPAQLDSPNDVGSSEPASKGASTAAEALPALLAAVVSCEDCHALVSHESLVEQARHLTDPELLDDYGGMAAFRASSPNGEQIVVIEKIDSAWRLRDISAAGEAQ